MPTETAIVIKCRCGLAFFALSAEEARQDHLAHYFESAGGEDHMAGNVMPISHPINNIHSVCRIMAAERKFEDAKVQVERRKQFQRGFANVDAAQTEAPGYERAFGRATDDGLEAAVGLWSAFRLWLGFVIIAVVCWGIWRVL